MCFGQLHMSCFRTWLEPPGLAQLHTRLSLAGPAAAGAAAAAASGGTPSCRLALSEASAPTRIFCAFSSLRARSLLQLPRRQTWLQWHTQATCLSFVACATTYEPRARAHRLYGKDKPQDLLQRHVRFK